VYRKLLKNGGGGGKGVRENNGKGSIDKVKYTHKGDTLRNPFEHQLKC
jgi:hypothetical protein